MGTEEGKIETGERFGSPFVSVIIPVHEPEFLEAALESVRNQTFANWHVIVVDDGSQKNVAGICADFPRLSLIKQECSRGVSIARNLGILESTGEYIAFLDHDDVWKPTKLEKQVAVMQADRSIGICHTELALIDHQGKVALPQSTIDSDSKNETEKVAMIHGFGEPVSRAYQSSGILTCSSVMIRRSALAVSGLFDPQLPICGDTDMWIKICMRYKLAFIPSCETYYRQHSDNQSKNRNAGLAEIRKLHEKYVDYAKHAKNWNPAASLAKIIAEAPRHYAAQEFDCCRKCFRDRNFLPCMKKLFSALRIDPLYVTEALWTWTKQHLPH